MQIINLEADISTPHLEVEMRTLRIGSGGTDNYPDLNNKPSINGTTLVGDILTANLGIKTSELTNDSGYITTADIPTKTSDLINDSDFTTGSALTAAIAAVSADIPTTTSQLTNDSGFLTSIDIPSVPTKTSDLVNDSGYITAAQAPVTTVNGLTGDVVINAANTDYDLNDTIKDKIDTLEAAIPTDTNDLTNGAGYITVAEAPVQSVNSQTGAVVLDGADIEYSAGVTVNSKIDSVEAAIPTDTNDLTNGAGYITAAEAPVQSVNGDTGTIILEASDIEVSTGVTVADTLSTLASYIPQASTISNTPIASFSNGADNVPVSELIIDIDANVSGYTEANIVRCGKNLLNNPDQTITAATYVIDNEPLYLPVGSYVFSFDFSGTASSTSLRLDDANGTSVASRGADVVNGRNTIYFSLSAPCNFIKLFSNAIGAYTNFQIEKGTTDTSFEQYNGTTYNIPFGQTVTTGGTLNVTTGVLDITGGSTIQLTPTKVKTLLNNNNFYTDTGNINKIIYFQTGCEPIARLIEAYT